MNPLNDDELNELLRRAKAEPPKVSATFDARVMRGYEQQSGVGRSLWRRLWNPPDYGHKFRLRNVLAAIALILVGALADRTLLAAHAFREPPKVDPPVVEERVVYKDCPAPSQGPGLTFNELQPVREIKPRVVRSMEDDR
jgi:hypothetical protein